MNLAMLGLRMGRRSPALISAATLGTKGFTFDPGMSTTLKQDSAGTAPVTAASDPVGYMVAAQGAAAVFTQATSTARAAWQSTYMTFDGTEDTLLASAGPALDVYRNVAAMAFALRFRATSLAAAFQPFAALNGTGSIRRLRFTVLTTGAVNMEHLRLDADTPVVYASTTGLVLVNTDYALMGIVDLSDSGSTAARLYLSSAPGTLALVASGAAVSTGSTSDTASARTRLGSNAVATAANFLPGRIGRSIAADLAWSAAQRAEVERWLWAA